MGLLPGAPVVVTGAAGFLGRAVLAQLGDAEVRALDVLPGVSRDSVTHHQVDLRTDRLDAALLGAHTVLHLAGCQYHSPVAPSTYELPFFEVNVEGTRRLLAAAQRAGVQHFVFVSTNMVYGVPRTLPVTETHPRVPVGPYGQSKLEAEELVVRAHCEAFKCSIVRPGLIVGPGRSGIIEQVFGWVDAGKLVPIIGDANNRYDVMHVDDVASLVLAAGGYDGQGAFNCASSAAPTMREWIEAVKRKSNSRSRIIGIPGRVVKPALAMLERVRRGPLRKDQYLIADLDYFMDVSLAKRELGWTPKWSGIDAVLDTYAASRRRRAQHF